VDASGQLAVRGGGPEDNQFWIDNIPWPVPFHFGGLLSTVGGDALDRVDLYAGAYPARWGGQDGAVVDAVTRRDLGGQWGGRLDLNLVLTDLFLEGPAGPLQLSLWGRRTYFDLIAGSFLESDFTLLPFFWDLGGTAQWQINGRHKLKALVNSTDDQLGLVLKEEDVSQDALAGEIRFRNRYKTLGVNWEYENGGFKSVFTPYLYEFRVDFSGGQELRFDLKPRSGGFRWDTSARAGSHLIKAGLGSEWTRVILKARLPAAPTGEGAGVFLFDELRSVETTIDGVDRFVYVSDEWEFSPGWAMEPGLRYNLPDNRELASLGPRLRVKNQYREGREAYLAWGQYRQEPLPQETDSTFGRADLMSRVADHYVAGWEARLRPEMSLRLEAYYKNYRRLVVEVPDERRYDNSGSGKARDQPGFHQHAAGRCRHSCNRSAVEHLRRKPHRARDRQHGHLRRWRRRGVEHLPDRSRCQRGQPLHFHERERRPDIKCWQQRSNRFRLDRGQHPARNQQGLRPGQPCAGRYLHAQLPDRQYRQRRQRHLAGFFRCASCGPGDCLAQQCGYRLRYCNPATYADRGARQQQHRLFHIWTSACFPGRCRREQLQRDGGCAVHRRRPTAEPEQRAAGEQHKRRSSKRVHAGECQRSGLAQEF
jgi:hypothetical protein